MQCDQCQYKRRFCISIIGVHCMIYYILCQLQDILNQEFPRMQPRTQTKIRYPMPSLNRSTLAHTCVCLYCTDVLECHTPFSFCTTTFLLYSFPPSCFLSSLVLAFLHSKKKNCIQSSMKICEEKQKHTSKYRFSLAFAIFQSSHENLYLLVCPLSLASFQSNMKLSE